MGRNKQTDRGNLHSPLETVEGFGNHLEFARAHADRFSNGLLRYTVITCLHLAYGFRVREFGGSGFGFGA